MSEYSAPVTDMLFVLEHLCDVRGLAELDAFREFDLDSLPDVLHEAGRFAGEVISDRVPVPFVNLTAARDRITPAATAPTGGQTRQLDAGNRMANDFARYYALTGIQAPSARAQDLFRVRGEAPDRSGDAARKATNAIIRIEKELGMVDHEGRPVTSVIKRVCILDDASVVFHDDIIGFLRTGLDALIVHYRLRA